MFTWLSCPFVFKPDAWWNRSNRRIYLGHSSGWLKLNLCGGAIWYDAILTWLFPRFALLFILEVSPSLRFSFRMWIPPLTPCCIQDWMDLIENSGTAIEHVIQRNNSIICMKARDRMSMYEYGNQLHYHYKHSSMYCGINRWAYFREKNTLCNNFIQKRGVGVLSRVGLFSGDYGM